MLKKRVKYSTMRKMKVNMATMVKTSERAMAKIHRKLTHLEYDACKHDVTALRRVSQIAQCKSTLSIYEICSRNGLSRCGNSATNALH